MFGYTKLRSPRVALASSVALLGVALMLSGCDDDNDNDNQTSTDQGAEAVSRLETGLDERRGAEAANPDGYRKVHNITGDQPSTPGVSSTTWTASACFSRRAWIWPPACFRSVPSFFNRCVTWT
jgi:hypothetical protein